MGVSDRTIILPDGTPIPGNRPVVIIGANGSGKTRKARELSAQPQEIEFINALRNTGLGPSLNPMSQTAALAEYNNHRERSRSLHWEMISDFSSALSQLLAEDLDSLRIYRDLNEAGLNVKDMPKTALQTLERLWGELFPGRKLTWKDWSPIVENERGEVASYTASQMSDGERAALHLMVKILLVIPDRVVVVDEPETHFHSQIAVKLWDALEDERQDLRFVYVTHDLMFALSRAPADFVLADPRSGLTLVNVDEGLPADIRRDILGAASFSYFASRIVFCEGEDHSLDKLLYSAWFKGRDTVVLPVSSCNAVRQSVRALNETSLIANLEAVGLVDRDYQPDVVFAAMEEGVIPLPIHEIEGLLCLPEIVERLSKHLGRPIPATNVPGIIQSVITDQMLVRAAAERTKLQLLNQTQDVVVSSPSTREEAAIREHFAKLGSKLSGLLDAETIFEQELELMRSTRDSGDVHAMVRVFPSKPLAAAIGSQLGWKVSDLFGLMAAALSVDPEDKNLGSLGRDLETILEKVGLPSRVVTERSLTIAANRD